MYVRIFICFYISEHFLQTRNKNKIYIICPKIEFTYLMQVTIKVVAIINLIYTWVVLLLCINQQHYCSYTIQRMVMSLKLVAHSRMYNELHPKIWRKFTRVILDRPTTIGCLQAYCKMHYDVNVITKRIWKYSKCKCILTLLHR